LPDHQSEDLSCACAKCDTDADLTFTLGDDVGHDAVDADRSQGDREYCEEAEEQEVEARPGDRLGLQRSKGPRPDERQAFVDLVEATDDVSRRGYRAARSVRLKMVMPFDVQPG
jgi:hypothetical protein